MSTHRADDAQTTEPGGKPSQAEGERDPQTTQGGAGDTPEGKPSQAEGSREQIEQDLEER